MSLLRLGVREHLANRENFKIRLLRKTADHGSAEKLLPYLRNPPKKLPQWLSKGKRVGIPTLELFVGWRGPGRLVVSGLFSIFNESRCGGHDRHGA